MTWLVSRIESNLRGQRSSSSHVENKHHSNLIENEVDVRRTQQMFEDVPGVDVRRTQQS